jgi:hypothetical protein
MYRNQCFLSVAIETLACSKASLEIEVYVVSREYGSTSPS